MDDQQSSGLLAKVRGLVQANKDLLRNAGSLAATTGLTSVFGFVFWILAANEYNLHTAAGKTAYGLATTDINAMQLLGTIGMFGLGTMLIGELPRRQRRGGLFAAALVTSAVGSLILGLGYGVVVEAFHIHMPEISGTLPRLLIFVTGVALTGATLVFDEGTIGLLQGGVQLWRNLAMSAIKLAALPITILGFRDVVGTSISLSFVLGTALSIVPAVVMFVRGGSKVWQRPDWGLLRTLMPVAINHNWLNLAIATPPRLIPVIVTAVVGPQDSGIFYTAWMIAAFLFMVPVHLSTVLFAIASASPELIAEKLRFVLRVSLMIGLPVMAVLAVGAHFALGLFGAAETGTVPLWLLIAGYLPQMPKAQYIAVSRATNKVGRAALLLCVCALFEAGSIVVGGKMGGLIGLSWAYLGVMILEGVVTAPTVLRAAYARTAAATGAFPVVSAEARAAATGAMPALTGPLARMTGELVKLTGAFTALPGSSSRQENGLAALLALATAATSTEHSLDVATEVWKTGGFPAISGTGPRPLIGTGPRPLLNAVTTLDLLDGQSAMGVPPQRLSYRHRQQAGIDVLLSIAEPEAPPPPPAKTVEPQLRSGKHASL
jgi:O-antigen/teichoic acid export membrane protein